ncbi:hypothetical protein PRIPAC_85483 [Pristionchus pacificus]|uniref:PDZ domain-containing protein n=1 Tax=Pristionchus pacificus TaxID=54126 RepID=A0A2A6BGR1_PRIPA|nr:hypothetical protein PRIPAC_85483 [Pristionchus pacificus]|eukprot:PDM65067.1 hypothetical protein PRIPAC_53316 [Pristionchus pacificus]
MRRMKRNAKEGILAIFRDEKKAKELASRDHIPADRERNIIRRDGFSYELVKMTWKDGGPKLGLGIKHFQNRVLVSKTDPASISAECLKIGDHVTDVNGQPVTDKGVARRMIVKAILSTGETSLLIARATTNGAKYEMEYLLKQKMHDYSDDDVPAITQKVIDTVTYCGKAKHSIISTRKRSPHAVSFER